MTPGAPPHRGSLSFVGENGRVFDTIGSVISLALFLLVLAIQIWALSDCARKGEQLFPAADKRTKGFWLAWTIGAPVVYLLVPVISFFAVIPSIVYLVDVRPALREVQSGGRW